MKLTVIILTRNCEETLARTLASVTFADEVLIIDDFSSDQTVQIANKFSVKVYQRSLDNNFASQRNFGLSKAQNTWVLFIDSDEVVSPSLREEILRILNNPTSVAYYLKRTDYFMGKILNYGETQGVRLIRLAQKESGIWKRPVHEFWNIPAQSIPTLTHALEHYPHRTLNSFVEKINRYTQIEVQHRKRNGRRFSLFELLAFPLGKFIYNYGIKRGFLDGFAGFTMAWMMSLHSLLVRIKMYEK